jgi:glycosyltransferase involved in cell wall biosynthesis
MAGSARWTTSTPWPPAVMDAMSNAHERKRRGRNALELIRAEYRWPVIAGRFEELYLQLTSGPAGQRR